MKTNSVYSRKGDGGNTTILGGVHVSKTDVRIEACGTLDELNSNIGFLISLITDKDDKIILDKIQNHLFVIGTNLIIDKNQVKQSDTINIEESDIVMLENEIDSIQAQLPQNKCFIIPGGTESASYAHVCRTVCRRAERCICALRDIIDIDNKILAFMNRLSDYLYELALKLNFIDGRSEKKWKKTCR